MSIPLTEKFNLVSLPEDVATAFAALQDNFYFLALSQSRSSLVIPGWDTTVNSSESPLNYAQPDSITLQKTYTTESPQVTRTIQISFTYTGTNPTTIVFAYGDGTTSPDVTTVTGGTMTCTYDGSGNLITATAA